MMKATPSVQAVIAKRESKNTDTEYSLPTNTEGAVLPEKPLPINMVQLKQNVHIADAAVTLPLPVIPIAVPSIPTDAETADAISMKMLCSA